MKFSIVIPFFNEEDNIIDLINEIIKKLSSYKYEYELILVDDFSNDESLKILNYVKKNINQNIKIIKNNKNLGQSKSIFRGIKSSNYDVIVTIDGDGQNNPADIPKLIELYYSDKEVSLIGGIRTKRQDSTLKKISSLIANRIRSYLLKDNCSDTGCSLKVFDKKVFLSFPFFDGIHRFLPALFLGYNKKTRFIEVDHRPRKYGYSKYGTLKRLFKGIIDIYRVIKIINNFKKYV